MTLYIQALWKETFAILTNAPEFEGILQSCQIQLQSHNPRAESERSGITESFSTQYRETTSKQYFLKKHAQNIKKKTKHHQDYGVNNQNPIASS